MVACICTIVITRSESLLFSKLTTPTPSQGVEDEFFLQEVETNTVQSNSADRIRRFFFIVKIFALQNYKDLIKIKIDGITCKVTKLIC
jgi:hypothetical protein